MKTDKYTIINAAFFLVLPFIFLYSSVHGMEIVPDSIGFLSSGSAFAPLYNKLMLLFSNGIPDAAGKARYLNLVLFLSSNLLLFVTIRSYSRSKLIPIVSTAAFALNKYVLKTYLLVHNEALGLFLIIALFFLMSRYLRKPSPYLLAGIAIVAGLIPPSRYAFSSSIIAAGVFFLFRPGATTAKRVLESAYYSAACLTLSISLLVINNRISLASNRVAGREFAFNGNADFDRYWKGLSSFSQMFFPTQFGEPATAIAAFGIIALIILLFMISTKKLNETRDCRYFGSIVLVSAIAYAALLLTSIQIEANLPLNSRYMVTFLLYFALLGGISIDWKNMLSSIGYKKAVILTTALLVLYFPANLLRVANFIVQANEQGLGYNSLAWSGSPTLRALKNIQFEKDAVILTNGAEVIRYYSNLKVRPVPKRIDRRTGKDYGQGYDERVQSIRKIFAMGDGYYIHFNKINRRFYRPAEEEVVKVYKMYPVMKTMDGTIYKSGLSMGNPAVGRTATTHRKERF